MAIAKKLNPHLRAVDVDFDSDVLATRADRIRWHHRERYLAAQAKLSGRQREVLSLLPMLFHMNHPALPGYGADAPCGIARYEPDPHAFAALRRVARSVNLKAQPFRDDIDAVFLMGSGGSSGHTADSDIDMWICCPVASHAALTPKLRAVEGWAKGLGVDVQGFLVDPSCFRDAGDSHHHPLLLDEFYRSGIWLAGRVPLWWYIPGGSPAAYEAQAETVLHQRFIDADAVIDFGPVTAPSRAVLSIAAMTELERALSTPHKSLLKLSLVDIYFRRPNTPKLSDHYQQLLFAGESDPARLDTYGLLYDYLEQHLPGDNLTLDEVRALFVRRILPRARRFRSHDALLERIRGWGIEEREIAALKSPQSWSFARCLDEYAFASALVEKAASHTAQTFTPIGAGETRLDEIRSHLSRITAPAREGEIRPLHSPWLVAVSPTLSISTKKGGWQLSESGRSIREASSYVDLLIWAHQQELALDRLRYPSRWFEQAGRNLALLLAESCDDLLFVNPSPDPMAGDETLISNRDDPLSYGAMRHNRLRQLVHIRRSGQTCYLRAYNRPQDGLMALTATARRSSDFAVTAAAAEDTPVARRIDTLVREARERFRENSSLSFAFGTASITLWPDESAFPGGIEVAPTS